MKGQKVKLVALDFKALKDDKITKARDVPIKRSGKKFSLG